MHALQQGTCYRPRISRVGFGRYTSIFGLLSPELGTQRKTNSAPFVLRNLAIELARAALKLIDK